MDLTRRTSSIKFPEERRFATILESVSVLEDQRARTALGHENDVWRVVIARQRSWFELVDEVTLRRHGVRASRGASRLADAWQPSDDASKDAAKFSARDGEDQTDSVHTHTFRSRRAWP